jgi:cell division topological specificity factor
MNLFNLFRRSNSAPVARDRLQILLAHERTIAGGSDLVALLREEILAVIKKHVPVDQQKVQVKMDRGESVSMLEVDIEIPTPTKPAPAAKPAEAAAKPKEAPAPAAKLAEAAAKPKETSAPAAKSGEGTPAVAAAT